MSLYNLLDDCERTGFPVHVTAEGCRFRITMRHAGHTMTTVDRKDCIGPVIIAMRRLMNSGNFCPTCGAVRSGRDMSEQSCRREAQERAA